MKKNKTKNTSKKIVNKLTESKLNKIKFTTFLRFMKVAFFVATLYSLCNSYLYVSQLASNGVIDFKKNIMDITDYYISSVYPYLFYCVVTSSLVVIVDGINQIICKMDSKNITEK